MSTPSSNYLEERFPEALEQGRILVYYQPVIRAISCKLCSFEALARWVDPDYGFISPGAFIPVLEQSRQIHLLDSYVVEKACERIRRAVDEGETPVPISVNLSRLDFALCDAYAVVSRLVSKYQIPHDFLYIEITESLVAEQGSALFDVIERFRAAGFQIWMDDFGSGYSSLNVLKEFPFDEIKLDMKFLSSFDQRSRRIMTSMVQMAKEIGIHTLAEGVETQEQFRFLRNVGCEKIQGFYFGRPMTYHESLDHLASLGVGVEKPAERAYYDSIGRVNILSAVPFMTEEEKDSLATARQLNSIPLAIAEARKDSFSVLFYNAAFEETASGTGLVSNIFSQETLRMPQPYSLLPERVIHLMDSTRSGGEGRMLFIAGEEYYEIQAKCIAQMPDAYCVLFRLSNLTKASEADTTSRLDDSLRQIYTLYERITIVDREADTILPLFVATRNDLVSGRSGLDRLRREYAQQWIFPEDQQDYLEFTDPSSVHERLVASGRGRISVTLRTLVGHGSYEWKEYVLLHLEGKTCLELIRNVHEEVAALVKRGSLGLGGTRSGEAPMESLVWRTLRNSDLIRVFWKDRDRRFLGASRGFLDYYGFSSLDDIVGKTDEELGWHVQPGHYQNDEERVIHEGITTRNEPGNCMSRGENRDILASKTPLYDENGEIQGLVGYFVDLELLRINDVRGSETKRRDLLTGLLNSRGIHEEARLFRDEYFLRGTDFVRLHVGIDDIASINAQYGYDVGDRAIAELGSVLKGAFGPTAIVGRFSGHQLAILKQIGSKEDELELRRLAKQAADGIQHLDGTSLTLYLSVGSCRFSETETLDEQTKKAEVRMLADHNEHSSAANRQMRASKIFHLYDDLPLSYSVYHVELDERGGVRDAVLFYINHAFERGLGRPASSVLGMGARELFPTLGEEWFDMARRAAFDGEIISDRFQFEPGGATYIMTVSQVIHSGYCCFTYQELVL